MTSPTTPPESGRVDTTTPLSFPSVNRGYNSVFTPNRLSVGLVAPLQTYTSAVPSVERHLERILLADKLGFTAVWLRDVPFVVDSFGDAGQIFDPFVYLGLLAGSTQRIALGVSSVILPLRHPVHVAKAAASADVLSGGRLILGVASGDRPDEFPAMDIDFGGRGAQFRDAFAYLTRMAETRPSFEASHGAPTPNMDLLPKPVGGRIPMLITGSSQQSPEWIANHGDGWMTYPRANAAAQSHVVARYRAEVEAAGRKPRPVLQPLYIDLASDPNHRLEPIHLGYRLGVKRLVDHLHSLQAAGISHVALNLRFSSTPIEDNLELLAEQVLPTFTP